MNKGKVEYPYIGQGEMTGTKYLITGVCRYNKDVLGGYVIDTWIYEDSLYRPKIFDITEEYLANKKIKILSPLHSEYVQKLAFKYGYGWDYGEHKEVLYTDATYLYFYKENKDICHSDWDDDNEFEEITIPLPEDYVSEEDESSVEMKGDVEEDTPCVKVGDNVTASHGSGQVLKGELLALTKEYAIIQQEGHEQHLHKSAWTLTPRTEEELFQEELIDFVENLIVCERSEASSLVSEFQESYLITKKPQ